MDSGREDLLPGSHQCVGCGGLTFRQRDDALCPRCAFEAESLIERIELDGLARDLQLMTEFEAYYQHRELDRARMRKLRGPIFAERTPIERAERETAPFARDAFWTELRDAS